MTREQKRILMVFVFGILLILLVLCVFGSVFVKPVQAQQPQENKVYVIAFGATWCSQCPRMKPVWNNTQAKGIKVVYVDIDGSPALEQKWKVNRTVPTTFVVYTTPDNPSEVVTHTKVVGVTTQAKFDAILEEARKERR